MAKHAAIICLEEAIQHMEEEIKAATKALDDRRKAVIHTEGHLAGYQTDLRNLNVALAMVKERVGS